VRLVIFDKMPFSDRSRFEKVDRMIIIWYIIIAPCSVFPHNLMQELIDFLIVCLIQDLWGAGVQKWIGG
jgi:hypothetical protein